MPEHEPGSREASTMTAIDPDMVRSLLDSFYESVRQDTVLGPVFDPLIGDGWPAHIRKINEFWLTALRLSRSYKGSGFMAAHLRHESIREEHMQRWLELFAKAVAQEIPAEHRLAFLNVANAMAENLRISLQRRDDEALRPTLV
jgi:hemoglobin